MSDPKTHWVMTYGLANGRQVRTTTRGRMEPMTEAEATQATAEVIQATKLHGGPTLTLPDLERGGAPTLVMVSALCQVDLERDVPENWSPEDGTPERDRRLRAVQDPGNYGPGQPRVPAAEPRVQIHLDEGPRMSWPYS